MSLEWCVAFLIVSLCGAAYVTLACMLFLYAAAAWRWARHGGLASWLSDREVRRMIRFGAIAIAFGCLFAGCVLAQPPLGNLPAPGPALPNDRELIQNAALFFKTAQTTAAAITETVGLVGKGVYFEGVKDGAMGAGLIAALAYWIVSSRKDPPKAT